jgi:hypothetical protein
VATEDGGQRTMQVGDAVAGFAGLLILAWRNAGWYGLDRYLLPRLGTPWHRGELFARTPAPGTRPRANTT